MLNPPSYCPANEQYCYYGGFGINYGSSGEIYLHDTSPGVTDDPKERTQQETCASELVGKLVGDFETAHPGVTMNYRPDDISVAPNWKIKFTFTLLNPAGFPLPNRFGFRPGIEFDYAAGRADVDAWQLHGDVASGFMHVFAQIIPEFATGQAEKPCALLDAYNQGHHP